MRDFVHKSLRNIRFSIKPQKQEQNRPTELARTMSVHPLTYQELPFDPEYSHYAGRLTTEKLTNVSPDEQYWKTRKELILRHTGEHPYEIAPKVDFDTQFEKCMIDPINRVLTAIGLQTLDTNLIYASALF